MVGPTVATLDQTVTFVKWFTPSDIGLEVAGKNTVTIAKLHDGKLPAKSGLKVGDQINAVDGSKVESAETFRRRLLRGVVNERCTLTVRRGDANLDVLLDFRADERAKEKAKPPDNK